MIQVDRFNLIFALTRISEQLGCQLRAPFYLALDIFQWFIVRAVFVDIIQNQRGIAQNGSHKIIEIMGNTAGQGADGFHLLGLVKLSFQPPSFFFRLLAIGHIDNESSDTSSLFIMHNNS